MSKKQFDHIEDRIREAAANSEPPFDEHAWEDMEARLNKDDSKRRFLFWWFTFGLLFITGTAIYIYNRPSNGSGISQLQKNNVAKQHFLNVTTAEEVAVEAGNKNEKDTNSILQKNNLSVNKLPVNTNDTINAIGVLNTSQPKTKNFHKKISFNAGRKTITINTVHNKKLVAVKKSKLSSKITAGKMDFQGDILVDEPAAINTSAIPVEKIAVPVADDKNNKPGIASPDSSVLKTPEKSNIFKTKAADKNKQTAKASSLSRFYFLASVGGEIGSVRFLSVKNNIVTATGGVGIGYQLSKKMSIQTGFYAGTKKYIAGPGDYTPKAGSYLSMVQIVKVNAACLIYDIPVTVRYNFLQKSGITYFATTGISSYIMKREAYDYYYVSYNVPYEKGYSYSGNKNAFSVLNFSAGIEKRLSSKLSLLAEPALSIPLQGVGEGRVKLYNTALQISIKYQPLKKH